MALYSPVWGIGIFTAALLAAVVLLAVSPYCRSISRSDNHRYASIDALRGYLAIAVFVTHAAAIKQWEDVGTWTWPPSDFYIMAGTAPVSIFFMITAFLFWGKAIQARGRVDLKWLISSRLRRLAPLYLCSIPVFLLLVGIESDWTLRTSLLPLSGAIARWLMLGVAGQPDVNAVSPTWILYPQVWTLGYEWTFYAALPALAFFWRPFTSVLIAGVIVIAVRLGAIELVVLNFAVGILTAELIAAHPRSNWLRSWPVSALALATILLAPALLGSYYGFRQTACLAPLFVSACYGNRMFGLLANGPARLLGAVSYSVYLLHVFVLHFFLLTLARLGFAGHISPLTYWGLIFALTLLLICVCVLSFRFVEEPWLKRTIKLEQARLLTETPSALSAP